MSAKPLILVLCTGNSCRSQMAEAFLREAGGDAIEVASAGSKPSGYVHPLAIKAMAEKGIELTDARSKSLATASGWGAGAWQIVSLLVVDAAGLGCTRWGQRWP